MIRCALVAVLLAATGCDPMTVTCTVSTNVAQVPEPVGQPPIIGVPAEKRIPLVGPPQPAIPVNIPQIRC